MLFDVVEEKRGIAEAPVALRLKQVEEDVEELKRGSKALNDDVHERLGKLQHSETLVSSRLERVEGDVGCLKRDLKASTDDCNERLVKLQQYALDSIIETAGMRYASTLKEWTGKETASVIYDSKVDPFTHDGIFNAVKGKPNIAVVGFTTDGDVFGGFYSVSVTEHGRCATPQRFVVKAELKDKAYVFFCKNNCNGFVQFGVSGVGWFYLGNERSRSFCRYLSRSFDGLEDTTLTGKNGTLFSGPYHHCARLVAIQLD